MPDAQEYEDAKQTLAAAIGDYRNFLGIGQCELADNAGDALDTILAALSTANEKVRELTEERDFLVRRNQRCLGSRECDWAFEDGSPDKDAACQKCHDDILAAAREAKER